MIYIFESAQGLRVNSKVRALNASGKENAEALGSSEECFRDKLLRLCSFLLPFRPAWVILFHHGGKENIYSIFQFDAHRLFTGGNVDHTE